MYFGTAVPNCVHILAHSYLLIDKVLQKGVNRVRTWMCPEPCLGAQSTRLWVLDCAKEMRIMRFKCSRFSHGLALQKRGRKMTEENYQNLREIAQKLLNEMAKEAKDSNEGKLHI